MSELHPAAIHVQEVEGKDLWVWDGGPRALIAFSLLKLHGIETVKTGELIEFGPWPLKVVGVCTNELDGAIAIVERLEEIHA